MSLQSFGVNYVQENVFVFLLALLSCRLCSFLPGKRNRVAILSEVELLNIIKIIPRFHTRGGQCKFCFENNKMDRIHSVLKTKRCTKYMAFLNKTICVFLGD